MKIWHIAVWTLVAWTAAFPAGAPGAKSPDVRNYGLKGPVRSIASEIENLAPDPRQRPYIQLYLQCGNCAFDRRGYFTGHTAISDGALQQNHSEIDSDSAGWPIEDREYGSDGALVSRTVFQNGPYGPLVSESFLGDRKTGRSENVYDERGRMISSHTWHEGELVVEQLTRWAENGEAIESILRWPQSHEEQVQSKAFDAEGNLVLMEARRNSDLIMRVTFAKDVVTSWFMKPQSGLGVGFSTETTPGVRVDQSSDSETGELMRTEYVHSKNQPRDYTEIRHYDPAGGLREKLTFDYEWDALGNWTLRTAYVWDVDTGERTAVQRIRRTISYY